MSSLRDQVLSQYRHAATTIASSSHTIPPQSPSSNPPSPDPKAEALQLLLHRQAHLLLKLDSAASQSQNDTKYHPDNIDLRLLQLRLSDLASTCMTAFYAYRFDLLPYHWRWMYTDTLILMSHYKVVRNIRRASFCENVLDEVVEDLDRALIVAGGAGGLGAEWIEKMLDLLQRFSCEEEADERMESSSPPRKKRKQGLVINTGDVVTFSTAEPYGRPTLSPERTCPRYDNWTLERFERYMNEDSKGKPKPVVFTDLIGEWPAFRDRPWNSAEYLLERTFGGRRLVPVEVGRSYVDEGWRQELVPFKDFLKKYIDPTILTPGNEEDGVYGAFDDEAEEESSSSTYKKASKKVGYLAQHNLFQQIPALRKDIQVPDFCWADVPPHPTEPSKNQPRLQVPQLNAWFGPAKTITPLHTDGYHNLLCQVVGTKYVRLYAPEETRWLRPRGTEHGVDMSNTSELDVGVLEGWDEEEEEEGGVVDWESVREELKGVPYWETVLGPGDTLVIPIGWWHYVRSLSISFSVSFWWN
ncbi:Clavaminate synthase-like protein [Trichoderma citrinoviride]|uniref:Clavaminate synthase-like protein n=1 Tax=Trichoderma citrinoviride TaxID=58853 RepID=A0A2T4BNN2_9HYPO|nr:Clavaminate synthase-like protein [Trichoderma citrinoviride]PTB70902.1 Clavaminate synthase-like protein [Trichoderma citrinoviride]